VVNIRGGLGNSLLSSASLFGDLNMEKEIEDMFSGNRWKEAYEDIKVISDRTEKSEGFSKAEASRVENMRFNRYRDVNPYDHSRVVLNGEQVTTDYINASLVKVPRANRKYILAQGPLPLTVGHFWLTVWQQRSKAVLMLNRVFEKGQPKCAQYWPVAAGESMTFEDVGLKVDHVSSVPGDHHTVRKFLLSDVETGESREIEHFHYTTWPDFGVPQCPDTFLEFLGAVRDSGSLDESVGPPVVHCSAGIGRSGTFVLVDSCLVMVAKEGPGPVKIQDVLLEMRTYRMGLIQTEFQLKFSYEAIAEGARQHGHVNLNILSELSSRQRVTASSDDSEDSDDDDAPPPLPPPRNESLIASAFDDGVEMNNRGGMPIDAILGNGGNSSSGSSGADSSSPDSATAMNKTTLSNRSSNASSNYDGGVDNGKTEGASSSQPSSEQIPILKNHKMEEKKREMELRRRNQRGEQRLATEEKIAEMKRKSHEADEWKARKAGWWGRAVSAVPLYVGLAGLAGMAYYMAYYRSATG